MQVLRTLLLFTLLVLPGFALGGDESSLLITHGPRTRPQVALTFDLCETKSKPAGFDPAMVITYGIHIYSGAGNLTAAKPTAAVIYVDSFWTE